jgi:hypothetical protein
MVSVCTKTLIFSTHTERHTQAQTDTHTDIDIDENTQRHMFKVPDGAVR